MFSVSLLPPKSYFLQSTWKRRWGKMWSKSSFAVLTFLFVSTSTAELWIEDRLHPDFNCQGNVTDAVCCMDHLCDHLSQSACQDGKPQNIFCQWDQKSEKCRPTKDDQGNVCCQSDPGDSACHDILINKKCPEGYEVNKINRFISLGYQLVFFPTSGRSFMLPEYQMEGSGD